VTAAAVAGVVGSLTPMSSFETPAPDLKKLVAAWEEWEKGEQTPGKVLANLKTAGLPAVLQELIDSGWVPGSAASA
jgi:hypothetical protein